MKKPLGIDLNVLIEIGGFAGHDYKTMAASIEASLEATGQFKVVNVTDDRDQFKKENISKYDLVICCQCAPEEVLTKDQEEGLVSFVESGKGLVGIHGATGSFEPGGFTHGSAAWKTDAYWKLLGGRLTGHGPGLPTFKVKFTGKRHVLVKGIPDFEVADETYCHKFYPESKIILLARRESDGEPVAWVQYYGKGRVFYTGLGHDNKAWDTRGFQELITRACLWATKRVNA